MNYICNNCKSKEVYEIEFRTDYSNARSINPLNDNIKILSNEDLPYELSMYFCNKCKDTCSIVTNRDGD